MPGKSQKDVSSSKVLPLVQKGGSMISKKIVDLEDRTLTNRHELKYIISESKAKAISQFISPYLHLDHYSKLQENGAYPIVSLYLDSKNLQLCQESLLGHKNRFKLRIRSYTDQADYPLFAEVKRRMNTIIIKSRARFCRSDISKVLSGTMMTLENKSYNETLKQFQLYMNYIKAAPAIRTRYNRQAYESDTHNRVRVTFDRNLCFKVCSTPEISLKGQGFERHHIKGVILEIKFTGRYPAWLSRMIRYFDLQARSMSKYASSVKNASLLKYCCPKISI